MSDERRRYFRIDDTVGLRLEPLAKGEIDRRVAAFVAGDHAYSLRNDYNFAIEQHLGDRQRIEARMPELARYLAVLEQQIERITERLIGDGDDELVRQKVNLSAQGMGLVTPLEIEPGALVELTLKLLPSGLRLVIIARAVSADRDGDDYRVALDFEHIHEADRELLIKHIHGKQMEQLVNRS